MRLSVVRVYDRGRKLSELELRHAEGVEGDVRLQIVLQLDGRSVRQAICFALTTEALPPLIEPQLVGISIQSLGLEGYEEEQTAQGIVYYRPLLHVALAWQPVVCLVVPLWRINTLRLTGGVAH